MPAIYLSIFISGCLFGSPFVYLAVRLYVCLFVYPSTFCLSVRGEKQEIGLFVATILQLNDKKMIYIALIDIGLNSIKRIHPNTASLYCVRRLLY